MEAEIRGKRRWDLQGVFYEDPCDARFFSAPVRESLADLLAGVAVGALREFVREARLPRVLPGLHPGFLPRLLGIRCAHVELHFPDRRRRRHCCADRDPQRALLGDRKSTRLNSSHGYISYAVFCLKKKKTPPGSCGATVPPPPPRLLSTPKV